MLWFNDFWNSVLIGQKFSAVLLSHDYCVLLLVSLTCPFCIFQPRRGYNRISEGVHKGSSDPGPLHHASARFLSHRTRGRRTKYYFFFPVTFILFIGVVAKYITKTCLHYTFRTFTYNCIIIPNLSIITKYYLSESELFLEMEQP